jgi:hypothetical protein
MSFLLIYEDPACSTFCMHLKKSLIFFELFAQIFPPVNTILVDDVANELFDVGDLLAY